MKKVLERFHNSRFYYLFNFKDDMARGRLSMFASSVILQAMLPIVSGIFYTGFLIANDIDIVNVGIISFVPFLASLFSFFSPYLLEHFQRRKKLLIVCNAVYYTINLLGITVLPLLVTGETARVIMFAVIIFVSGVINAITAPGFTAWHLKFIPDDVRADHFSYQQIACSTVYGIVMLISGIISDSLNGSQYETTILFVLRIVAFCLAMINVLFLSLPKELPYEKTTVNKLSNIFTLAFSHKSYLKTMGIIALWTFFTTLAASPLDYYLLNTAKVKYTFIGIIDASYAVFLYLFSGMWRKFLKKNSWMKTFALTSLMHFPTYIMLSFVNNGNHLWLMTVSRYTQHFIGVGLNLSYANMPYIHIPAQDRTNYMAFYTLVINISSIFGTLCGAGFIAATREAELMLFSSPYTSAQMLVAIKGIGQLIVALLCLTLIKSDKCNSAEIDRQHRRTAQKALKAH